MRDTARPKVRLESVMGAVCKTEKGEDAVMQQMAVLSKNLLVTSLSKSSGKPLQTLVQTIS